MFEYSDPTKTGLLARAGALGIYRGFVDREYQRSGSVPDSAFATLDAFAQATAQIGDAAVQWSAFPKSRLGFADQQIDAARATLQDEYVEWRVERDNAGRVTQITFTTDFPEYYFALAAVGSQAVVDSIKELDPSANPTVAELFGQDDVDNLSPIDRLNAFADHFSETPWNTGQKGIMGLIQTNNTLRALFALVDDCAIPRPSIPPGQVCGAASCVPARDSDPRVCSAVQTIARSNQAITLTDPVGIEIFQLNPGSDWELDGDLIDDINQQPDLWRIVRNGRRATLNVSQGLTLNGDPIVTAAQVSREVQVRVHVQSVNDSALPVFARVGNENLRV